MTQGRRSFKRQDAARRETGPHFLPRDVGVQDPTPKLLLLFGAISTRPSIFLQSQYAKKNLELPISRPL